MAGQRVSIDEVAVFHVAALESHNPHLQETVYDKNGVLHIKREVVTTVVVRYIHTRLVFTFTPTGRVCSAA
jgi:hypothetical protein